MSNFSEAIKDWAATHYGIHIPDYQINRVEERVHKLRTSLNLSEETYFKKLEANDDLIINKTLDALTVQETYFFRDASLFLHLKNTLLPELIATKRKQKDYQLNIWSAGCASGEEIYSIAIYLDQLLPDIKQWKIGLLATDINAFALAKGKKGIFTKSSMRATDNQIISDYFEFESSVFFLKKNMLDRVTFQYGNIAKMKLAANKYDLIFCRNVFIYLDKPTILSALSFFYDSLIDNGALFLGHSDLVTYYPHNFSLQNVNNISLLKKVIKKQEPLTKFDTSFPNSRGSYYQTQQIRSEKLQDIRHFLDKKNYIDALEKIDNYLSKHGETALLHCYKGEALIGLSDIEKALVHLTKAVQLDPLDAKSYFLKSLCEIDLKNNEAAIVSLQKTLYIKSKFPEAAYRLGLLYIQNNHKEQGLKLLKQSLSYAIEQQKNNTVLNNYETMEQFINAIKVSILYHQGLNNGH